jgi:hypothetical protein
VLSYLINCISKTHCYVNRSVSVTISYSFEEDHQSRIVAKRVQIHVQKAIPQLFQVAYKFQAWKMTLVPVINLLLHLYSCSEQETGNVVTWLQS